MSRASGALGASGAIAAGGRDGDADAPARLRIAVLAPAQSPSRATAGPAAAEDEDVVLRLSLWLADVALEAARGGPTAAPGAAPRGPTPAQRRPGTELP